jgi:predicted transcriptional regulator
MIIGQSIRSIQRKLKEEESGSSKKNSDHSKAEIISKMACRLNQKLEAANPKTLEKLRENSEFTDQIRKLHKWLENT